MPLYHMLHDMHTKFQQMRNMPSGTSLQRRHTCQKNVSVLETVVLSQGRQVGAHEVAIVHMFLQLRDTVGIRSGEVGPCQYVKLFAHVLAVIDEDGFHL